MHRPSAGPVVLAALAAIVLHGPVVAAQEASAPTAPPARGAAARLTPGQLREDVRVLRAVLDSVHPGAARYLSRGALAGELARLEREFDRERTVPEAFLAISRLTSRLRDGHTFPNPNNQARAVAEAVFRTTPRVPFYFRWLDRRMVVTRDASAARAFPPGTEILAIDGVPAATILARLLPYARTDGNNEAKRVANLELRPGDRWQAFDVYYPLVMTPPAGDWRFRVRTPEGAVREVVAPPVDAAQRQAVVDSLARASRDTTRPPWTLTVHDDGIAVLAMPSWVMYNNAAWDWRGFIARTFADLVARDVPNLVIDLRGNEGGDAVGDVLLAHLVDSATTVRALRRYVRYRTVPAALRPHLDTWDRSFDDWSAATSPAPERPGFWRLVRAGDDTAGMVVRPAAPRYRGRVFVLVDAENSSATFLFALAVRQRRLGTLVGQPTGGNQQGINGGAFYFLRLPNSRIEVDIPLIGQWAPGRAPDAGVSPDIVVRTTAADVAAGRDPELAAVRRAIARGVARR